MKEHYEFVADGGYAVFYDILGSVTTAKNISSPLRDDKKPSARIYNAKGTYFLKDFGTGDTYNYLSLIKAVKGITGQDRFEYIAKLYNYDYEPKEAKNEAINKPKPTKKEPKKEPTNEAINKPKEPTNTDKSKLLSIELDSNFTASEIAYWQNKLQISDKNELIDFFRKEKMTPVRKYSYLNKQGKELTFEYKELVFAIELRADKCYRILNCNASAKVKSFTVPSYKPMRSLDKDWQYSIGLLSLDTQKDAILCAGEKDYFALKVRGYNCFTLGSETPSINSYISDLIQHIGTIKVLYDTDFAGVTNSKKLTQNSKFERIELPKLDKEKYKEAPLHIAKNFNITSDKVLAYDTNSKKVLIDKQSIKKAQKNDICDYLQLYGYDYDLRKALNSSAVFCEFDRYLGNNKELFSYSLTHSKNVVWNIATGAGKTTSALKHFREFIKEHDPSAIVIFCAPLSAIVEQVGNEYTDMQVVCEGNTSAYNASLSIDICTTYQSAKVLLKRCKEANIKPYLIVDEIHELLKSASYQHTQQLYNFFKYCKKIIGLTATIQPIQKLLTNYNFYTDSKGVEFDFLECKRLQDTTYNIKAQIIKKAQISNVLASLLKNEGGGTLIFRESRDPKSKQNCYEIASNLTQLGIPTGVFTGGLSAKEKKQNKHFWKIVEDGALIEKYNLVATSVLECGVSIKHNIKRLVYVASKYDINSFKQAINRIRAKDIEIILLIIDSDSEKKQFLDFDITELRKQTYNLHNKVKELQSSQKAFEVLKTHFACDTDFYDAINKIPKLPNNLKSENISYCKHQNIYTIDYFKAAHELYTKHIKSISKEAFIAQIKAMQGVNYSDYSAQQIDTQKQSMYYSELQKFSEYVLKSAFENKKYATAICTHVKNTSDNESIHKAVKNVLKNAFNSEEETYEGLSHKIGSFMDILSYVETIKNEIDILTDLLPKKRKEHTKKECIDKIETLQLVVSEISNSKDKTLIDCIDKNLQFAQRVVMRINNLFRATQNCIGTNKAISKAFENNSAYGLYLKRIKHIACIELEGYVIFDTHFWQKIDNKHKDKLAQIAKDKLFISSPEQFEDKFKSVQSYKAHYSIFFNAENDRITLNGLIGSFGAQKLHDLFAKADISLIEKIVSRYELQSA